MLITREAIKQQMAAAGVKGKILDKVTTIAYDLHNGKHRKPFQMLVDDKKKMGELYIMSPEMHKIPMIAFFEGMETKVGGLPDVIRTYEEIISNILKMGYDLPLENEGPKVEQYEGPKFDPEESGPIIGTVITQ